MAVFSASFIKHWPMTQKFNKPTLYRNLKVDWVWQLSNWTACECYEATESENRVWLHRGI